MYRRLSCLILGVTLSLSCQRDPWEPVQAKAGNNAPRAIIYGLTRGPEGLAAEFSAQGSSDADGDSLSYRWDFGDGGTGTEVRPVHTYVDNGTYTVTLIVKDPHQAADTATSIVTIDNWAPGIDSISLSVPAMPAPIPAQATIQMRFSDLGPNDNPTAVVDWGDGLVSTDTTHAYTIPGAYSVSVTVTDKDGAATTRAVQSQIWVYDSQRAGSVPGYDVIDLHTLGGTTSQPYALNNNGEVVGRSETSDGQSHAFLWKDGFMRDIGASLTGSNSAQVINDDGWIAGAASRDYDDNSVAAWRNGTVMTSRTGGEDNRASAVEVDDAGTVLVNISGHEYGSAALWRAGELIQLGGLTIAGRADAMDMNRRGQIVGASAFQYIGLASYAFHAFLWQDGVMKDLGDLGYPPCDPHSQDYPLDCGYSIARGINERGQIVGAARAPSGVVRAVIWETGDRPARDLGFGTGPSRAVAINERGQIAGETLKPNGYDEDGAVFRDTDGSITNLGSLGGGSARVVDMNDAGHVVGTSRTPTGEIHPFVWTRGAGMVDLGTGPFGAKGVGAIATGINERGDVIGFAGPCQNVQFGRCDLFWGPTRAILWRAKAPAVVQR